MGIRNRTPEQLQDNSVLATVYLAHQLALKAPAFTEFPRMALSLSLCRNNFPSLRTRTAGVAISIRFLRI